MICSVLICVFLLVERNFMMQKQMGEKKIFSLLTIRATCHQIILVTTRTP